MNTFLTEEELYKKLVELNAQRFTQIRTPGGTSKNKLHFSAVIVFYYDEETDKIYFLGLPYNPDFYKKNGENFSTKVEGETPPKTAVREIWEETGIYLEEEDLVEIKNAQYSQPGHTKYFFLCERFDLTAADFKGQPNPIEAETSSPIWIEAKVFTKVIYKGHAKALGFALEMIKSKNMAYAYALMNLHV